MIARRLIDRLTNELAFGESVTFSNGPLGTIIRVSSAHFNIDRIVDHKELALTRYDEEMLVARLDDMYGQVERALNRGERLDAELGE